MQDRWLAIRERYMRDDLPTRLGGLAANLARIASFTSRGASAVVLSRLIEESKFFIEWTASDTALDMLAVLVELQVEMALWHQSWLSAGIDSTQRERIAQASRTWAERVLEMSGLLAGHPA